MTPQHHPTLRVFLSSTFRDFMQERDLLVKEIFPELRRKARQRGVDVVDVDLRWGITQEESEQGKVIPICLGEIDRCRPYFIGLVGDRYGWIPPSDQYSAEVKERQPWLKQHLGVVSVTELEILHGVLNDPDMAGRAFFIFAIQHGARHRRFLGLSVTPRKKRKNYPVSKSGFEPAAFLLLNRSRIHKRLPIK